MLIKVGINGYGRTGRNILRALYESKRTEQIQMAINDLGDAPTTAHLTRFDTAQGKFPGEVKVDGDAMVVNGDRIRVLAEPYNEAPLVSVDFKHEAHSAIFDATLTKCIDGVIVKVCAWYDNEWGFSNRILDTTLAWSKSA
jgi:glyceraldehyde-3-phosphate dehydrogenase/erythrose-4-phosphate dehydrogenase